MDIASRSLFAPPLLRVARDTVRQVPPAPAASLFACGSTSNRSHMQPVCSVSFPNGSDRAKANAALLTDDRDSAFSKAGAAKRIMLFWICPKGERERRRRTHAFWNIHRVCIALYLFRFTKYVIEAYKKICRFYFTTAVPSVSWMMA